MSWPVFYFVVSGLITLAVVLASLSFFSRQMHARKDELNNTRIIKQRLAEVEREFQEGLISAKDKTQAEQELKLALVDESQSNAPAKANAGLPLIVGALIALCVAAWVYSQKNQLSRIEHAQNAVENLPALSARLASGEMQNFSQKDLSELALAIRQRLRQSPDDDTGWLYFGRLMMSLGQQQQAKQAVERARSLSPNNREYSITLAQILMSISDVTSLEQAKSLLLQLLSDSPDNDNLALMMAVVSAQLGELDMLTQYFEQVKNKLPADSDIGQRLMSRIAALSAQEQEIPTPKSPNPLTGFRIDIALSEDARAAMPKSGFLVVFAQDALSDNKMPAAVVKMPLPGFPVSLQLDTSHAMLPSLSLANLKQVVLTARISEDENVTASAGDWQGVINAEVSQQQLVSVSIVINKEVM